MKQILKLLLFLSIGFGVLFLLYYTQQKAYSAQCAINGIAEADCSLIDKLISDFRKINPFYILLIVFCSLLSHLVRALRWGQLIEPMGYKPRIINSFGSIVIAFFANLGFPRSGELVRATTLSKYENIPLEKLFGTVITDRITDMIVFVLIVAACFLLEYDLILEKINQLVVSKDSTSDNSNMMILMVVLFVAGLAFLWFVMKSQLSIALKIRKFVLGLVEGISSIKSLKNPALFVFYTISIWALYIIMLWLCFPAFGPTNHLGIKALLVVFTMGALGFLIPSPGGMGTYHFLIIQGLSIYGVAESDGFSFANIAYFSGQLFSNVLFGILFLVFLPWYNRNNKYGTQA